MYSTCLFCNRPLGANEIVEHFPVGRRLAYDAAKGRLWVVCQRCERWNLTPIEERWEAIDDAERLFRDSRLRVATDNVGLARLRDGTELVRIGAPQRPEFAAWRYGDQFGRRRRRHVAIAAGGATAIGAVIVGGVVTGVGVATFAGMFTQIVNALVKGRASTEVATIPQLDGRPLRVLRGNLAETRLTPGEQFGLELRHTRGVAHLEGRDAERAAAQLMPRVNRFGGSRDAVRGAVSDIESAGGSEGYIELVRRVAPPLAPHPVKPRNWGALTNVPSTGLFALPTPMRLALEMSLHEESERRAMAGELAELEAAWRHAEEIAAIADEL